MRVTITEDDALITNLIIAARNHAETFTNRAFMPQEWELILDCFPYENPIIEIPKPPLQSVESIKYIDSDGTLQTLATSKYQVDIDGEMGRVAPAYGLSWPSMKQVFNAVTIAFTAGYEDVTFVPEGIKTAIKMFSNQIYDNRDSFEVFGITGAMPGIRTFELMLWPYRIIRFN